MDLLWPVLGLAVVAVTALGVLMAVPFYRRRNAKHTLDDLNAARATLLRLDSAARPHLTPRTYIPERIARPLRSE
ncbi:MAG TPA: hypothetical protein VNW25_07500, partial [Candidatus Sulfotelmatobacter sp.]|nr:hypothetical protein [Candidatus Sulfotelmatobacter sp.]